MLILLADDAVVLGLGGQVVEDRLRKVQLGLRLRQLRAVQFEDRTRARTVAGVGDAVSLAGLRDSQLLRVHRLARGEQVVQGRADLDVDLLPA